MIWMIWISDVFGHIWIWLPKTAVIDIIDVNHVLVLETSTKEIPNGHAAPGKGVEAL